MFAHFLEPGVGFVYHAFVLKCFEKKHWVYLDGAEEGPLYVHEPLAAYQKWDERDFLRRALRIDVYIRVPENIPDF